MNKMNKKLMNIGINQKMEIQWNQKINGVKNVQYNILLNFLILLFYKLKRKIGLNQILNSLASKFGLKFISQNFSLSNLEFKKILLFILNNFN